MQYDLIIIGGGPAGAAGGVYAARKQLKTLLVTFEFGGQSVVSDDIQNWIGTPHISGAKLAEALKSHVMEYRGEFLEVVEGVKVTTVTKNENITVTTDDGKTYESKALLITTGGNRRQLPVPGADRLEHRGLTYCASCDGPIFADQDVVVIGGGNAAFESAAQLLAYCKSVTILTRGDSYRADEITVEKVLKDPKIRAIKNVEMLEVLGEKFVTGMKIKHKDTTEETLPVTGIFVEIGQIPNTDFVKDLLSLNEFGKIVTDPMTQQTSVPGIWAAGDATNGLYHQNNIAAGDAVKALENIYLSLRAK